MTTLEPARASALDGLNVAMIMLASVGFGLTPLFAKGLIEAGLAPPAIAFFRFVLVAVLLSPFLVVRGPHRGASPWGVFAGAAMGGGWIGYVASLEKAPVATAGVLYMTYPLFTIAIGWAWTGDRPSARALVGAALVLAAAVVAAAPAAISASQAPALLLALTAPLTFGFAINVLTLKLTPIAPLSRLACVALGAALSLAPLALSLDRARLLPADPADWRLIAGVALLTALIPQLLYSVFAPRIGATKSAVAGSIELPTMLVIGWAVFAESMTANQWIGAALIIVAILVTPARRARNVAGHLSRPSQ